VDVTFNAYAFADVLKRAKPGNLFSALNNGSLILINTAKDLLQKEGCELLGRFFIALIGQAVQERAVIEPDRRRSTFVYIDEAHDYFDSSLDSLLNTARKYNTGLILAHQNLDQLDRKLKATIMSSTSVKIVGGLSSKDAKAFAEEIGCEPEIIRQVQKDQKETQFIMWVRNHGAPTIMHIPFSQMEDLPRLSAEKLAELLENNRRRISSGRVAVQIPVPQGTDTLAEPELL
jgi:type IV secretory system conjugative DNA transfer VirD4/TraG family protein